MPLQVCLCSGVWFLLQKDNTFIYYKSRDSHWAPLALTVTYSLLCMSLYHSDFWTAKTYWTSFLGLVEVAMVALSLPTYMILTSVLWSGELILSDRFVVFLLPLHWVLYPVASTWTCWLHATYGTIVSIWLMKFRLPLKVPWPGPALNDIKVVSWSLVGLPQQRHAFSLIQSPYGLCWHRCWAHRIKLGSERYDARSSTEALSVAQGLLVLHRES